MWIVDSIKKRFRLFASSESSTDPYDGRMNFSNYIEQRFEKTKNYYKSRSNTYRFLYFSLQALILIAGALIPIVNASELKHYFGIDPLLITSFLGIIIVIFSGILQLFKAREIWHLYGSILNQLETEYELFIRKVTKDYQKTDEENERTFVERIEKLIMTRSVQYFSLRAPTTEVRLNDRTNNGT